MPPHPPLRPRAVNTRNWSLSDTYAFLSVFFEAQARRTVRTLKTVSITGHSTLQKRSYATTRRHAVRTTLSEPYEASSPAIRASVPSSCRHFHNYFVTHLPSSSLHPDSRSSHGPGHKLPRSAAAPHKQTPGSVQPAAPPHMPGRDLTVVRIPLRSAKHHFGTAVSRGQRPYNEDADQAGTIDMPAFAKRAPISLVRNAINKSGEGTSADSAYGDPQLFYFAVFDGHGGTECSEFLKTELHGYIEVAAKEFDLGSSLRRKKRNKSSGGQPKIVGPEMLEDESARDKARLKHVEVKSAEEVKDQAQIPEKKNGRVRNPEPAEPLPGKDPLPVKADVPKAIRLQEELLKEYRNNVGGYFRRFNPAHFSISQSSTSEPEMGHTKPTISVESVVTYAFLRADIDFITAQAHKPDPDDPYVSDFPLNNDEILGSPHLPPSGHGIGGKTRFKGGSTASVALISTPTPAPFWHPAAYSTLLVAHVGDSRIVLCETATGLAKPLTSDHHPSSPGEARRLRRYAASFVTDSFGEERIQGLANSRAFGDMQSKRLGVSAEPELTRIELGPAEYSFLVLMSDGVSGTLSDQEIVDVVKEAKTPEQGARDVVSYATEVSRDGDNATCSVVRLGGWERRSEGGLGSLGTKEIRDFRRNEANDPRRGRR